MSTPKPKEAGKTRAKDKEQDPEAFGWKPGEGGLLTGASFARPPCPVGSQGYHQYVLRDDLSNDNSQVWKCRLCDRRVQIDRITGRVR